MWKKWNFYFLHRICTRHGRFASPLHGSKVKEKAKAAKSLAEMNVLCSKELQRQRAGSSCLIFSINSSHSRKQFQFVFFGFVEFTSEFNFIRRKKNTPKISWNEFRFSDFIHVEKILAHFRRTWKPKQNITIMKKMKEKMRKWNEIMQIWDTLSAAQLWNFCVQINEYISSRMAFYNSRTKETFNGKAIICFHRL